MIYIDIHTHHPQNKPDILEIHNTNDLCAKYLSIGIHPWDADQKHPLHPIENALSRSNVLALGEIGLDRHITLPFETQKEIFIKQLEINRAFNKPVIIHAVKAHAELLQIKKAFAEQYWIIHGFNRSPQLANQLIDAGLYLSFGKTLFQDKTAFASLDHNKIFLETDDQTQFDIYSIYQRACQLKKLTLLELQTIIGNNFQTVFKRNPCAME